VQHRYFIDNDKDEDDYTTLVTVFYIALTGHEVRRYVPLDLIK
jgi:hypothetical protein